MKIRMDLRLCTDEGERFFGEGPYRLLLGVEELGSLRAAAKRMGMAYTKAFVIIKRAEAEFGFALTRRTIGGKGGGSSRLTDDAKELIKRYEAYRAACAAMADSLYLEYFQDFRPQQSAAHLQQADGQDHLA